METRNRPDRFTIFLVAACAVLAILTLLLSWQNRSLKAELAAAVGAPPPGALKIGDTIGAFDAVDAEGRKTRIAFDGGGKTLLLVFSSTCGACQETVPVWNQVITGGVSSTIHIVGIQTDRERADASGASPAVPDLRFPVFGVADPRGEPLSKFPVIPAAALVDTNGAVELVWFGVPTAAQTSELRRAVSG